MFFIDRQDLADAYRNIAEKLTHMEQKELKKRLQRLVEAKDYLKREFIGLDEVVDKVIHLITPWYALGDLQERPTVINLWGLTGTGKTDLVQKLMQFLGEQERTYRMEMSRERYYGIRDTLESIYKDRNGQKMVLMLDEFQHARTIDDEGKEKDAHTLRSVWDLLDHGQLSFYSFFVRQEYLLGLYKKLSYLAKNGVKVANGIVSENESFYSELIMEKTALSEHRPKRSKNQMEGPPKELWFIPQGCHEDLFELFQEDFASEFEFKDHLRGLNESDSAELVLKAMRKSFDPKAIDCSKALVFVIGNLDEAYELHTDTSSDSNATNIRKQSEKVSLSKVKRSLLARFRAEQVARLGNNHVIYPAFGEAEFMALIKKQLKKLNVRMKTLFGMKSNFDHSLLTYLMKEGVTPTQGARPLFGTITQTIESVIPFLLIKKQEFARQKDQILHWEVNGDAIRVSVSDALIYESKLFSLLEKMRTPKKDDQQSAVAVHESGHALVLYLVLGQVPVHITSQGSDDQTLGQVTRDADRAFISRTSLISELAVSLAGIEAERLIFGDEHITMGATADLQSSTSLAKHAINRAGLGKTPIFISNMDIHVDHSFKATAAINDEARALIVEAQHLAAQCLTANRSSLLKLASYLADHSSMTKAEFEVFAEEQGLKLAPKSFSYREHLLGKSVLLNGATSELNGKHIHS